MSFVFKNKDKLLIAGIILLACNLRSPITGVGSLISYIMNDLHLSGSISGLITTVPLIAFAVVSPFAGKLSIRFGTGKTLTVRWRDSRLFLRYRRYRNRHRLWQCAAAQHRQIRVPL